MIRFIRPLAIGLALIGALTPSGFGQIVQRRATVPARPQANQVAAPVQVPPAQVQPVQVPPAQVSPVRTQSVPVSPVQTLPAETSAPAGAAMTPAEKSVRQTLGAYVAAYNQKDPARLVELFAPDGTLIDTDNAATRGREAIAKEFSESFAEPSTYTLEGKVEQIRFVTPDVAEAEGISRLVSPREATIANRFVALLARQGEGWKFVEVRDYPAPAGIVTSHERLKELEWMVGDWVADTEDAQVSSTVRWGQGAGYLVRDYSVHVKGEPANSGLMIIAWDPQSAQIKSWIFNADGSRGEGSWTRAADNQWVVKAHGSTADGRASSATQIISQVNKDAIRTSSTDRIVGDEIARDIEDLMMVRKPTAPGTTLAPTPASAATAAATPTPR